MNLVKLIAPFLQAVLAKSVLWGLVSFIVSIPLGLILLKVFDGRLSSRGIFLEEIEYRVDILYLVLAATCFVGMVLARTLAISIKVFVQSRTQNEEDAG